MTTLAEKETQLAAFKAAYDAARFAFAYGQGDRSVTRQRLSDLAIEIARISREIRELTAAGNGANNPGVVTPTWS